MTSENLTSSDGDQMATQSLNYSADQESSAPHSLTSLANDAPLSALLKQFPRGFSTIDEGQKFVKQLQAMRLSPQTLRSALQNESQEIEKQVRPRKASTVKKTQAKVEDILKGLV